MQIYEERNTIFARLQTHLAKNDSEKQGVFIVFACVSAKNACENMPSYLISC